LPLLVEQRLKELGQFAELSIVRGLCIRENITYKAKQYCSSQEKEQLLEVKEYIEAYFAKFSSLANKVLVFCPTKMKIQHLGELLDCPVYYADLPNKEEVLSAYLTSQDAHYKILVSSSALEEGIDYPSIRLVVYIDFVYSFIGLLQGSSRAGRDGLEATSMFFFLQGEAEDKEQDAESEQAEDKHYIRQYLKEQVCRRRPIDLYLDGLARDSCTGSMSKCDLCLQRDWIQEGTINNLLDANKAMQAHRDRFRELVLQLDTACLPCLLLRREDFLNNEHGLQDCLCYTSIHREVWKLKQQHHHQAKFLSKDSCCFACLLPTLTCASLKEGEGTKCFNTSLVRCFFALCLKHYKELGLEERLKVQSFKTWNVYSLEKVFFAKVFVADLSTQAIQGIVLLREALREAAV
jgi:superfamily II DNA/RNA helicase